MAHNLKKFQTEAEYSAATLNYPAVSWITSGDTVMFDKATPAAFGGLTVKYDIADPSVEVNLFNGGGSSSSSSSESGSGSGGGGTLPSRMIVDGVEETPINTWRFETAGVHTVQYEFTENAIPNNFLDNNGYVVEIEIGDEITRIPDESADGRPFGSCINLTSVTISSSVTYIGSGSFGNNAALTSITVKALDPPTLGTEPFGETSGCTIYVPASSVEMYQTSTSTGWSEYASIIQAIP